MSTPSDLFRYFGGNRPSLGSTHQALLDACYAAQDSYASRVRDRCDPFRGDCWIVNRATPAQIAAVGFCEWNYQVHNGGMKQFFSNLHGFGLYYIDAMMRVLEHHENEPLAQEMLAILWATIRAISPQAQDDDDFAVLFPSKWIAADQFAECRTSEPGLRIPISETCYVDVAGERALHHRFFALNDDELIIRMDQWLVDCQARAA